MTSLMKAGLALCMALALSACGAPNSASRAAMPDDTVMGFAQPDYRIDSFTVSVPQSLEVNERNSYYPVGDIVWRGDPLGDRHAQVQAIFEDAMRLAAPKVQGDLAVRVDIQVLRFHAVSEKARYTVGGVHDISFRMRVVDTTTGALVRPTEVVDADLDALSGQAATAADARGQTQKERITAHLSQAVVNELTLPGGHRNASLGLLQAINGIR